jgi:uncharacterized protein (DUF433 family)
MGVENKYGNEVVVYSPDVLSGAPVFARTRVPVQALWDYLVSGDSLDQFLEDFPTVTRSQALEVIRMASECFLDTLTRDQDSPAHAHSAG